MDTRYIKGGLGAYCTADQDPEFDDCVYSPQALALAETLCSPGDVSCLMTGPAPKGAAPVRRGQQPFDWSFRNPVVIAAAIAVGLIFVMRR